MNTPSHIPALSADDILTNLRTVQLPDGSANIVEAGRISAITIRGTHVGFVLETTAADSGQLETACRNALTPFPGIEHVSIVTTEHTEKPSGFENSRDRGDAQRGMVNREARGSGETPFLSASADNATTPTRRAQYNTTPIPSVARIIAIASGKGGVGKSTLTVLLAHALAARGHSVGILDADIHGPSIPRMLGLESTPPAIKDGLMVPARAHGIMANSIGLISGDTAAIWRGPMVSKALAQLLRGTDWAPKENPNGPENSRDRGDAKRGGVNRAAREGGEPLLAPSVSEANNANTLLLIDLPPGTGDIQLSLMQSVPVDAAIIITTPQEIATADARKAATMFTKLNIPILGIVENMSHIDTASGERLTPFGTGGGQALADAFHVPLLTQLPLDPAIGSALDTGKNPLDTSSHISEALTATLDKLLLH